MAVPLPTPSTPLSSLLNIDDFERTAEATLKPKVRRFTSSLLKLEQYGLHSGSLATWSHLDPLLTVLGILRFSRGRWLDR